jgi:hypothetical protein
MDLLDKQDFLILCFLTIFIKLFSILYPASGIELQYLNFLLTSRSVSLSLTDSRLSYFFLARATAISTLTKGPEK